jgi:hypothetical protein
LLADERGDDLRSPLVLDAADVLHLVDRVLDGCAPAVKTINSKTGRKKKSGAQA